MVEALGQPIAAALVIARARRHRRAGLALVDEQAAAHASVLYTAVSAAVRTKDVAKAQGRDQRT